MLLTIPLALTGKYGGFRSGAPLEEAHPRAINSFVDSKGFGLSRMKHLSYWNEQSILLEGRYYRVFQLQLIGLTTERTERVYVDSMPPKKSSILDSTHRPLSDREREAVAELRNGSLLSSSFVLSQEGSPGPEGALHVMGAMRYSQTCLQCHKGNEGDLAGAFLYTMIP